MQKMEESSQNKGRTTNLPFGFKVNFMVTGHRRPTGMYFHLQLPSALLYYQNWHKRKDETKNRVRFVLTSEKTG